MPRARDGNRQCYQWFGGFGGGLGVDTRILGCFEGVGRGFISRVLRGRQEARVASRR